MGVKRRQAAVDGSRSSQDLVVGPWVSLETSSPPGCETGLPSGRRAMGTLRLLPAQLSGYSMFL